MYYCSSGTHFVNANVPCDECGQGQFQNLFSQSSCKVCASGKWSNETGQRDISTCLSCESGKTSLAGSVSATSCIEIVDLISLSTQWDKVKQLYKTNSNSCNTGLQSKVCPNQNINLNTWECTATETNDVQKIFSAITLTYEHLKHLYNKHHCNQSNVCSNKYLNITSWECTI